MMITRSIGKVLRGKATPLQIMLACVLGSMIGFVPGFANGPGLLIALLLLLIVLNANLGVAILIGGLAKLLSLAAMPVSFAIGRFLLDGPTQGLFKTMINAPVLAWFGFDHYATSGGMVLGLAVGLVAGMIVVVLLNGFRRKMAGLEESSEAFKRITSSFWSRALVFVFIGGRHGKKTYQELAAKKVGNPIRVLGVVFALLVVGLLFLASQFASEPIVTAALKNGLERTNGATVEVGSADLDLKEGRLTVSSLAMADPNALDTDIFRAALIEADVSGTDLLRKRMKIDRMEISDATSGDGRAVPGKIVGNPPRPVDEGETQAGEKTIEDYIDSAKQWKERLAQARRWLEKVSGSGSGDDAPAGETLRDRLAREVAEKGYARVVASHLVDQAPTLLVGELVADGVRTAQLEGEVLDIRAENLSTHPHLVQGDQVLSVKSRSGKLLFESASSATDAANPGRLAFLMKELDVDRIAQSMSSEGLMKGGTMDVSIDGTWGAKGVGYLDLPMQVTLHDTNLSFSGSESADVKEMVLPIALRGPMDDPKITIDSKQLSDALLAAGADRLAGELRGEAGKLIDDAAGELGEGVKNTLGDAVKGLLPGGKKKDGG